MRNKKFENAMTMAEIMIVLVILAIITAIFLAMPKKNTSNLDKAKYYMAYSVLKTLQNESIAASQNGINTCADLNANVDKWVNTIPNNPPKFTCPKDECLTNGINLSCTASGSDIIVAVDLNPNEVDSAGFDLHYFKLNQAGETIPFDEYNVSDTNRRAENNMEWVEFQVFKFGENGKKILEMDGKLKENYINAKEHYNICNNTYHNSCYLQAVKPMK